MRKAAEVQNLTQQADAAQGNLDAVNMKAETVAEEVEEEVAALTAGDDSLTEDYDIGPWREIDHFIARSTVEHGFYAELMSLDARDAEFEKGVSWTHRWIKINDVNYSLDHRRAVQDQSYRMATEHADIAIFRCIKDHRFAASPMEIIRSIPNWVPVGGGMEAARYPFFDSTRQVTADYVVSLRAAAMIKAKLPAEAISRMTEEALASYYKLITGSINLPGIEGTVMDGTMRFVRDWSLHVLQTTNDEPNDPMSFQFGTVYSQVDTPSPTATVVQKLTLVPKKCAPRRTCCWSAHYISCWHSSRCSWCTS